jgi:cysteine sulfinate desulfinase/cysteine desulfurase-like protein
MVLMQQVPKKPIYLDYNATTPIDPEVHKAMDPYLREHFGNPSSTHQYGRSSKEAVEKARQQVSELISARPEEVIFTSGGSESDNHAILGVALANSKKGKHIITSRWSIQPSSKRAGICKTDLDSTSHTCQWMDTDS